MKPFIAEVEFSDPTGASFKKRFVKHVPYDTPLEEANFYLENIIDEHEKRASLDTNTEWAGEILSTRFGGIYK